VIDFRYHLVSIIAVFLALAVGLAVGSTALTGTAEQALTAAQHRLTNQNKALTKQNGTLQKQVAGDQAFASANSARLLAGLLTGEHVVLIAAPGADSTITTGLTTALREAGATVTGQVSFTSAFTTTSGQTEATLSQLAQNLAANAGLPPPAAPDSTVSGQQEAAQVLAAALAATGGLTSSASQAILGGFSQRGFITVDSGAPASVPAEMAVLVTPAGPPPQQSESEVLVAVASELKSAGSATVMAGAVSSIGSGSVISAENNAANAISTVDNADTETGQILVVQALRFTLDGKRPAPYGAEPAAAPSPGPTPSVPATPKPSASAKGH
jgi:hypothetical protein